MSEYALHHGDCLDILPTLAPGSVDAVICDPPYGTTACKWDSVIPFAPMWEQITRVLRPRGACVLFGSQPFTSALVMSNPGWFRYEWVWEKTVAGDFLNAKNRPLKAHENVLVFSQSTSANRLEGRMTYNPQIDFSMPAYRKIEGTIPPGQVYAAHSRNNFIPGSIREREGRMPRSVVKVANGNFANDVPTQKPLALLEYLVKTYTNAGDVVLDFAFGSGTTGAACGNLGRAFVGIEKDAEYFRLGSERIATAYAPLRMMQAADAVEG